jgi:tartrate-resistant acid phosphatase type 5
MRLGALSGALLWAACLSHCPAAGAQSTVRFAVIGDYGEHNQAEADVARLVGGWGPDFVVTVGDNNCPDGAAATMDANVGEFYSSYIYPYQGAYGPGAGTNRFFPTLGNHDWNTAGAAPYLDYFALPGNERYYDYTWGPLHLYALDSDPREPDGVTVDSAQAAWLRDRLGASTSPWDVVCFHHPPFSSGPHGSSAWMQWPFDAWGTDAVFSGHDHDYERLLQRNTPYFVDGMGGSRTYSLLSPVPGSEVRYTGDNGAMLVEADADSLRVRFYTRSGALIDDFALHHLNAAVPEPAAWLTGLLGVLLAALWRRRRWRDEQRS